MPPDLSALGWDDTVARAYRPLDRADSTPGRVLRADRGVCTVLDASGVVRASLAGAVLLAAASDPARLPCAGDWVVLRRWPDRRITVDCVLPRRTALINIIRNLVRGYATFQDLNDSTPANGVNTGRWFQVVDKGGQAGNWTETSCSAMYAYTIDAISPITSTACSSSNRISFRCCFVRRR